jgi:hypothetical protein
VREQPAVAFGVGGERDVPTDHPELDALFVTGGKAAVDLLANGAERVTTVRREGGEVFGNGGRGHGAERT